MKNDNTKINKKIILEKTLALIDERKGIKDVTLRDIAKKVGCAHTNLYNYFESLDDIFWEALGDVLNKMMEFSVEGLDNKKDTEEGLNMILSRLIDFSVNHPGWYRLIWLDSLSGTPSLEIMEILKTPSVRFEGFIKAAIGETKQERASSIANIMLCYLHGELCIWLNDRSLADDKENAKQRILLNLQKIYRQLS